MQLQAFRILGCQFIPLDDIGSEMKSAILSFEACNPIPTLILQTVGVHRAENAQIILFIFTR